MYIAVFQKNADYRLLCALNPEGKELYGLVHMRPGGASAGNHFHPLALKGDYPELYRFLIGDSATSTIVELWQAFQSYADENPTALVDSDLKRRRVYLPGWDWQRLHLNDDAVKAVHEASKKRGRALSAVCRISALQLTCYSGVQLLEVLEVSQGGSFASYVLYRTPEATPVGQSQLVTLDGAMDIYGAINAANGVSKIDKQETLLAYLRFFFFVKAGRHGRFYFFDNKHDIPVLSLIEEQRLRLESFEKDHPSYIISEAVGTEPCFIEWYCIFKDSLFTAKCQVAMPDWVINLTDQKLPIEDGLDTSVGDVAEPEATPDGRSLPPVRFLNAGVENKAIEYPVNLNARPLKHYSTADRPISSKTSKTTASEFLRDLASRRVVQNRVVQERVVFHSSPFEERHDGARDLRITDCTFESTVVLSRLPEIGRVHFERCSFQAGLSCQGARLACDVGFFDCVFETREPSYPDPGRKASRENIAVAFDACNAVFEGSLTFWCCNLKGRGLFAGSELAGDLTFQGCFVGPDLPAAHATTTTEQPTWTLRLLGEEAKAFGVFAYDPAENKNRIAVGTIAGEEKKYQVLIGQPILALDHCVVKGNLELGAAAATYAPTASLPDLFSRVNLFDAQPTVVAGEVSLKNAVVEGNVTLVGYLGLWHITFENTEVQGGIDLGTAHASVPGAKLQNGSLRLLSTVVKGGLNCMGLQCSHKLAESDDENGKNAVELYQCEVGGNIELSNARLSRALGIERSHVKRLVDLRGSEIKGDVSLMFTTIEDGLWAYPNAPTNPSLRSLVVEGDLDMLSAKIRFVRIENAVIRGFIRSRMGQFGQVRIGSSWSWPSRVQGETTQVPKVLHTSCRGLQFTDVTVETDVRCPGLRIDRSKEAQGEKAPDLDRTELGFIIKNCRVGGSLSFFDDDPYVSIRKTHPSYADRFDHDKAERLMSLLDNMVAWDRSKANLQEAQPESGTYVWNTVDLTGTSIGGRLDLRNMWIGRFLDLTDVSIGLDLLAGENETVVREEGPPFHKRNHSYELRGLRTVVGWFEDQQKENTSHALGPNAEGATHHIQESKDGRLAKWAWRAVRYGGPVLVIAAVLIATSLWAAQTLLPSQAVLAIGLLTTATLWWCWGESKSKGHTIPAGPQEVGSGTRKDVSIQAEKLNCQGDMILTGLCLKGDLLAEQAEVKGNVELAPIASDLPQGARLHGQLNLCAAHAGYLSFSAKNFPQGDVGSSAERLVLERADFDRLDMREPAPCADLTGIKVYRWKLGSKAHPIADDYVSLLEKARPFHRGVWMDVEKTLRDQAEEAEADEVRRAMQWNARNQPRKRWERYWSDLGLILTGYRTAYWLLLIWWLGLTASLAVSLNNPQHIVTSSEVPHSSSGRNEALAYHSAPTTHTKKSNRDHLLDVGVVVMPQLVEFTHPLKWDGWDATTMALRYTIPIIEVKFHEDYDPNPEKLTGEWLSAEFKCLISTVLAALLLTVALVGLTPRFTGGK